MGRIKIEVRSHGFIVTLHYLNDILVLKDFNAELQSWKMIYDYAAKKNKYVVDRFYGIEFNGGKSFGYQINLLNDFIAHLKNNGISQGEVETVYLPEYTPAKNTLSIKDTFSLRDEQPKIVDHILSDKGILKNVAVIPLQTGGGKTCSSLYSVFKSGLRASVVLSLRHRNSWLTDIAKFFEEKPSNTLIIDTNDKLVSVIELANNDKMPEVSLIIFSTVVLKTYFKEYETLGTSSYGCLPQNLYKLFGVGIRITDEAHEDLHFHFKHDILTHSIKSVCLSATLISKDELKNRLFETIYPTPARITGLVWKKYIIGVELGYRLKTPNKIKCLGSRGYSHSDFEKSIMENKATLIGYFSMVLYIIENKFIPKYTPGQKILVYFFTTEMANLFVNYVNSHITNKQFRPIAFIKNMEESELEGYDIVVSNMKKSGTGKNIPGLTTIINTIAVNSFELNLQSPGRIREIKESFPGVDPVFYYLVCLSIRKHIDYHNDRLRLYRDKFAKIITHTTNFII